MDRDKFSVQQIRPFRKRLSQWTGEKIKGWIEPQTGSTTTTASETEKHSSTAVDSNATALEGHNNPLPSQSSTNPDHHRLQFPAIPFANVSVETYPDTELPKEYPPHINVACVEFLGNVQSSTTYVKRDLGFQGRLGNHVLLSYGDTMYSDGNYSDKWRGMTSDSIAFATHDPLVVVDPVLNNDGYPPQFCPLMSELNEDPAECALGITNVVEIGPGQGIIYFLLNHRPNGVNNLMGAGVATVHLKSHTYPPRPSIKRLGQYWWDATNEPWYGDICALRWGRYVYAYGHGGADNPWIYLTRVQHDEATRLECYEYWNGVDWQKDRLMTKTLGEVGSVFWQINQGQVVWSRYFGCLIFIYCDNWMNSKVLMKTSQRPEGPWSEPMTLYQATPLQEGSSIYAAVPHPYFDESGKTLVVTFTNHPNTVQAIRITFD